MTMRFGRVPITLGEAWAALEEALPELGDGASWSYGVNRRHQDPEDDEGYYAFADENRTAGPCICHSATGETPTDALLGLVARFLASPTTPAATEERT